MSPNTSDQAKRKMLILMIFAPGIFFIIYWFAIQSGNNHTLPNKIKPPVKFETIGQSVRADNTLYTARKGSRLFTDQIDLRNNVAIAEPGAIFLGLGLEAADSGDRPDAIVISRDGSVFRPLDIDSSIIAKNFDMDMDVRNKHLYLFKVRTGAGYYYFQVNNKPELTWRIKEGA